MQKSIAVVTPTTGSPELLQCVESVKNQTYTGEIKHHIIADGYNAFVDTVNLNKDMLNRDIIYLPENVGANGWYGHRIYAAWSYLVNQDYIMFLDQDNWLDEDHVALCVETLESGNHDWVYSLRSIHDPDGKLICDDNCESLGAWPTWVSDANGQPSSHIDTSCFFIKREVLVSIAGAWYGQWGQDRVFFHHLAKFYPNFAGTGYHTVNYRLGGNPGSVTKEFFLQGNEYMKNKYNDRFPWENDIS